MGLGLQTVAERTCCRSKLCETGASDSCRDNILQKQALWDWGFRQLQREHAVEASTVGLGLQTVAERTCCRSKLCGTGASDSCRENMLLKQALWDWGFRQLERNAAEASSVRLGLQTVAEITCCRSKLCGTGASISSIGLRLQTVAQRTCRSSKLCGTGASDSFRENILQKQALYDWGFRQLQREHAAEASSVRLGLQTVAERTCCRSKHCETGASDSCRENMLQKQALWDWGFKQLQREHAAEASSVRLELQTVAVITCCSSKLCETGALDSCRENMLQKQALWDWGFTKLCGTGASDSCKENMLQEQAL